MKSFSPFDREWEELKKIDALQRYKRGYALRTSEVIIPKSFMLIYLGAFVLSVAWIAHATLSEPLASLAYSTWKEIASLLRLR